MRAAMSHTTGRRAGFGLHRMARHALAAPPRLRRKVVAGLPNIPAAEADAIRGLSAGRDGCRSGPRSIAAARDALPDGQRADAKDKLGGGIRAFDAADGRRGRWYLMRRLHWRWRR